MNEPTITVVGNLTDAPELRFTPSGVAVANFTVAQTPRTFDKARSEYVDGDPLFLSCSVWKEYAEHVAETLTKGMRIIVHGRLKSRSYEARDGSRRTVFEVEVEKVGPSLRYATATITRTQNGQRPQQTQQQPVRDPWASPTSTDEPPF